MTHDVIIAGGGVAGCAAAAALAQLNYQVLIVEPGLDHARRLAGELIHPPGAADLSELGLLRCLEEAGAVPVHGFAVFAQDSEILRYSEVAGLRNTGIAIEHGAMVRGLLRTVEQLSNVTIWRGARVTGIDVTRPDSAAVMVMHEGRQCELHVPLLVAADGRSSHVRRMAGIAHKQIHISNMIGFSVKGNHLPYPGFGHVFAEGPAPVLAYAISPEETRIMFDVPVVPTDMAPYLDALPSALRADVEDAIGTQTPLRSANYSVTPEAVVRGRVVHVGDAGGCCHPVTASGLSAAARDAMLLRKVLHTDGDITNALRRYAGLRQSPQRTRMAGAEVLYEVLKAATPETYLLRRGLMRYWQQSPSGRAATMALLSTSDDRPSAVVREYMNVFRCAVPELIRFHARRRAIIGLSAALVRFLRGVL